MDDSRLGKTLGNVMRRTEKGIKLEGRKRRRVRMEMGGKANNREE